MVKLKRATNSDFKGFIELEKGFKSYNESLKIDAPYKIISSKKATKNDYKDEFIKKLSQGDSFFYFAMNNGEHVGYIFGFIAQMPKRFKIGKVGLLDVIVVSKKSRGKGVGKILKKEFFKWLKKKKIKLCQLHVSSKNKKSLSVFEKWGFEVDMHRMFKKI